MTKNIVIIGGGYAGLKVASELEGKAKVTVIDRNDYFHHKAAALRGLVMDGWDERIYVDFEKIGLNCDFIKGQVTNIEAMSKTLNLSDGQTLTYDDLVIATGSTTKLPTETFGSKGSHARKSIAAARSHYSAAKTAIIVGDGPVGVEMAGEFRDLSPEIDITIVSGATLPMETVGNVKFSSTVNELLKKYGITRIGNIRAVEVGERHVLLDDGRRLEADIIVEAGGILPNTHWIKSFAPEWLDDFDQIKVDADLSVTGHSNIHALGDSSDIKEPKMLKMADNQAQYLAAALIGKSEGEIAEPYQRFSKKLTILPFGAKDGVALLPIGQEGTVVWRALGRFLVVKRKGTQLLSNMFPSSYAAK